MRDLGFHPWIWAWKHSATCEFQPLNLSWNHILLIFFSIEQERRIRQISGCSLSHDCYVLESPQNGKINLTGDQTDFNG